MTAEILRQSALFRDFTPVGVAILARIAQPRIVLAGKPLFVEGEPAGSMYLIAEGRFQIQARGQDGKDVPLATLRPVEHLSELSLLASGKSPPHLCSAVAEIDSRALEIASKDFFELMGQKPQACIKLLLAVSQQLAEKFAACREPLRSLLTRTLLPPGTLP